MSNRLIGVTGSDQRPVYVTEGSCAFCYSCHELLVPSICWEFSGNGWWTHAAVKPLGGADRPPQSELELELEATHWYTSLHITVCPPFRQNAQKQLHFCHWSKIIINSILSHANFPKNISNFFPVITAVNSSTGLHDLSWFLSKLWRNWYGPSYNVATRHQK